MFHMELSAVFIEHEPYLGSKVGPDQNSFSSPKVDEASTASKYCSWKEEPRPDDRGKESLQPERGKFEELAPKIFDAQC